MSLKIEENDFDETGILTFSVSENHIQKISVELPCANWRLSIKTLIEEIKSLVLAKSDFGNRKKSFPKLTLSFFGISIF